MNRLVKELEAQQTEQLRLAFRPFVIYKGPVFASVRCPVSVDEVRRAFFQTYLLSLEARNAIFL